MEKTLLVSVQDRAKVSDVARQLASAGMKIKERDETFHLVTGSADSRKLGALKRIPGVQHIEEQRVIHSPSPDAAIQ
jgi:AICAR transformylase/IMP cyclohydrolase PurH